jgi:hypothetical protein
MQALTPYDFRSHIASAGWLELGEWQITPRDATAVRRYKTTLAQDATAGADMSELFLKSFMVKTLDSGLVWIYHLFPANEATEDVFKHFLSLNGIHNLHCRDFRFLFQNDYDGLLSTLSWCIACGWGVYFISTTYRYLFVAHEGFVKVMWLKDELLGETAEAILRNLEFPAVSS